MSDMDEWVTSDDPDDPSNLLLSPAYRKDKFYIKATDGHGHSAKIQVKLHESEAAMIAGWVGQANIPYRTNHDFIRDAIAHRLHELHELHRGGKLDKGLREMLVMATLNTERVLREQRAELLKATPVECQQLLEQGQVVEVEETVEELSDVIEEWPAGQRRQAEQMLSGIRSQLKQARK